MDAALAAIEETSGGIDCVVATMRHLPNAEIQANACALLGAVAAHAASKEKVARAGGVEQIMRAMYTNGDDARLQQVGCDALRALSAGDGGISEYDIRRHLRDAVIYDGDSAVQVHQLLLAAKAKFAPQCAHNVNATMHNLGIAAGMAASASFATLAPAKAQAAQSGRPATAGAALPQLRGAKA